jgi:DNA replication protein DnaC
MQATLEQLKDLKLTGLMDAWTEQHGQASYQDLTFDERFALLVEREYLRRQHQRLQRRLKQAQLFSSASIAEVDFAVPRGLKKLQFLEWAQGHWLTQRLNLMILGPTGVGKTFLACTLADHLCKQGHAVRYFKTADLILELKLAKADGSFPKLRKQLTAFPLVVLDEWLRDELTPHDARELLDFLDNRYRIASCLFVSQFPVNEWHQKILDPTLADAILDRIVHDSLRLTLKGESMRKLTSRIQPAQRDNYSTGTDPL